MPFVHVKLEYEFRVAGRNHIGYGQEAVQILPTPEGAPSGPPTNITYRFQTPDVVVIRWDVPALEHRNGRVTGYLIQFYKKKHDFGGPGGQIQISIQFD